MVDESRARGLNIDTLEDDDDDDSSDPDGLEFGKELECGQGESVVTKSS